MLPRIVRIVECRYQAITKVTSQPPQKLSTIYTHATRLSDHIRSFQMGLSNLQPDLYLQQGTKVAWDYAPEARSVPEPGAAQSRGNTFPKIIKIWVHEGGEDWMYYPSRCLRGVGLNHITFPYLPGLHMKYFYL